MYSNTKQWNVNPQSQSNQTNSQSTHITEIVYTKSKNNIHLTGQTLVGTMNLLCNRDFKSLGNYDCFKGFKQSADFFPTGVAVICFLPSVAINSPINV